jgi:ABC-type Na+ efflux pump permease subunit
MHKILVIAKKDLRDLGRTRSTYLYLLVLILVSWPYFSGLTSQISSLKESASPADVQAWCQVFINSMVCTLPFALTMLLCSAFSAYTIVLEKAKRTLESLMSTPISLRQIWIGKSLSVALPGVAAGLVVTYVVLAILNYWVLIPQVGGLILPQPLSVFSSVIVMPLLAFMLVLIVSYFQLTMANPRIASLAYGRLLQHHHSGRHCRGYQCYLYGRRGLAGSGQRYGGTGAQPGKGNTGHQRVDAASKANPGRPLVAGLPWFPKPCSGDYFISK